MPLVLQELFEWWAGLRYAVDWNAIRNKLDRGNCGVNKAMGRFTRSCLTAKVKQLMLQYSVLCLVNGNNARMFNPTSHWFKAFEYEYGLSMRKPNCQYKLPRSVVMGRCKIGW